MNKNEVRRPIQFFIFKYLHHILIQVLDEHMTSWMMNGLSSLKFHEETRTALNEYCEKICVDVCLNNHWTDLVCGDDNTQLDTPVEELKRSFQKGK